LGEYLDIIETDVTKIVSAVKSQLKVNTGIESKKLLPVEVISFLEKYAVEYNERANLNFKVEFEFEKEVFIGQGGERIRTFILANDDLLRDLFDNLIDNAVKHAFEIDANNRIKIFLMKNTENEDTDEIQVLVSNTGKPFPEHFTASDFIRKGSNYGTHAGDGFGGWYITEIIKKLDGDFDIIDETGGEGLPGTDLATSFEINFPIIETEENASI
jgi:type I restriction enzyme M protein